MTGSKTAAAAPERPRRGGSYIRDPKTGKLTCVSQNPAPAAPPTPEAPAEPAAPTAAATPPQEG